MSVSRDERLAQNEVLFRQVNERLKDVAEQTGVFDSGPEFVCECSDDTCTSRIRLSLDEYERLRADPRRFVVLSGHEAGEIERVVVDRGSYCVVEKLGEAAEVAEQNAPEE